MEIQIPNSTLSTTLSSSNGAAHMPPPTGTPYTHPPNLRTATPHSLPPAFSIPLMRHARRRRLLLVPLIFTTYLAALAPPPPPRHVPCASQSPYQPSHGLMMALFRGPQRRLPYAIRTRVLHTHQSLQSVLTRALLCSTTPISLLSTSLLRRKRSALTCTRRPCRHPASLHPVQPTYALNGCVDWSLLWRRAAADTKGGGDLAGAATNTLRLIMHQPKVLDYRRLT